MATVFWLASQNILVLAALGREIRLVRLNFSGGLFNLEGSEASAPIILDTACIEMH